MQDSRTRVVWGDKGPCATTRPDVYALRARTTRDTSAIGVDPALRVETVALSLRASPPLGTRDRSNGVGNPVRAPPPCRSPVRLARRSTTTCRGFHGGPVFRNQPCRKRPAARAIEVPPPTGPARPKTHSWPLRSGLFVGLESPPNRSPDRPLSKTREFVSSVSGRASWPPDGIFRRRVAPNRGFASPRKPPSGP